MQGNPPNQYARSYFKPALAPVAPIHDAPMFSLIQPQQPSHSAPNNRWSAGMVATQPQESLMDGTHQQQQQAGITSMYDLFTATPSGHHHQQQQHQFPTNTLQYMSLDNTPRPATASPMSMGSLRTPGGGLLMTGTPNTQSQLSRHQMTSSAGKRTPMQQLNPEFGSVVTIFGFLPESSSAVLSLFRQFGTIVNYQYVGNSNWINVEYENDVQAQTALSKNGLILNGDTMVGVAPMRRTHLESHVGKENSLSTVIASPSRSGRSPSLFSPNKSIPIQQSQQSQTFNAVDQSSETRPRSFAPASSNFMSAYKPSEMDQTPSRPPIMHSETFNLNQHSSRVEQVRTQVSHRQPTELPRSTLVEHSTQGQAGSVFGKVMESIFGWG